MDTQSPNPIAFVCTGCISNISNMLNKNPPKHQENVRMITNKYNQIKTGKTATFKKKLPHLSRNPIKPR